MKNLAFRVKSPWISLLLTYFRPAVPLRFYFGIAFWARMLIKRKSSTSRGVSIPVIKRCRQRAADWMSAASFISYGRRLIAAGGYA